MAKKEREALAFVRKTKGAKDILFAVTGMPERTTAPKETAHQKNKYRDIKLRLNVIAVAIIEAKKRYFDDCSFIKIILQC